MLRWLPNKLPRVLRAYGGPICLPVSRCMLMEGEPSCGCEHTMSRQDRWVLSTTKAMVWTMTPEDKAIWARLARTELGRVLRSYLTGRYWIYHATGIHRQ